MTKKTPTIDIYILLCAAIAGAIWAASYVVPARFLLMLIPTALLILTALAMKIASYSDSSEGNSPSTTPMDPQDDKNNPQFPNPE